MIIYTTENIRKIEPKAISKVVDFKGQKVCVAEVSDNFRPSKEFLNQKEISFYGICRPGFVDLSGFTYNSGSNILDEMEKQLYVNQPGVITAALHKLAVNSGMDIITFFNVFNQTPSDIIVDDLRIGNFLYDNKNSTFFEVESIKTLHIPQVGVRLFINNNDVNCFSPLIINRTNMEKLGVESRMSGYYHKYFDLVGEQVNGEHDISTRNNRGIGGLKYVHQVQNALYWLSRGDKWPQTQSNTVQ